MTKKDVFKIQVLSTIIIIVSLGGALLYFVWEDNPIRLKAQERWGVVVFKDQGLHSSSQKEDRSPTSRIWAYVNKGLWALDNGASWEMDIHNPIMAEQISIPVQDIQNLELDWASGKVIVEAAQNSSLIICEGGLKPLKELDKMIWSKEGNTLKIKEYRSETIKGVKPVKLLIVQVPEELAKNLHRIKGYGVSADVEIKGIKTKNMDIQLASGDVKMNNVDSANLLVESVSGDVILESVKGESTKISNVSGGIEGSNFNGGKVLIHTISGDAKWDGDAEEIEGITVSGDLSILLQTQRAKKMIAQTTSGDIKVILPGNETLNLTNFKGAGDFTSNLPLRQIPEASYKIQSRSGDVEILGR